MVAARGRSFGRVRDNGSGSGERLLRSRGRGMSRAKLPVAFPVASLVFLRAIEDDFAARAPRQLVSLVADRADHRTYTVAVECLRTTDYRSGHVFNIHSNAAAAIADDISSTRDRRNEENLARRLSAYALSCNLLFFSTIYFNRTSTR